MHVIDSLGRDAIAEATGVKRNTVDWWVKRQAIPARKWPTIIHLAERKGVHGITLDSLARATRKGAA